MLLSFLHEEVSQEKGIYVTTVYRKSTFSSVYTHFERFLPTYKFGMVYTLAYCCFFNFVLIEQSFTKKLVF